MEELETEDFLSSAAHSPEVSIDQSTLVRLEPTLATGVCVLGFSVGKKNLQVSVSAGLEHPFFVFGRGWSSCSPSLSMAR